MLLKVSRYSVLDSASCEQYRRHATQVESGQVGTIRLDLTYAAGAEIKY